MEISFQVHKGGEVHGAQVLLRCLRRRDRRLSAEEKIHRFKRMDTAYEQQLPVRARQKLEESVIRLTIDTMMMNDDDGAI